MANKIAVSLRVDKNVLDWFKRIQPKGYQTYINSLLAQHVEYQKQAKARLIGRAQEIFKQYYTRSFWHYSSELQITDDNLHLVISGLKKHGGWEGLKLAEELCH